MLPRANSYMDELDNQRVWGWPQFSSSQGWVQKIRSWCYAGDMFCASGTGPNAMAIHNSYGMNAMYGMYGAEQWAQYMVSNTN
jgi:hypothetical protein